jgi:hypothetical protein
MSRSPTTVAAITALLFVSGFAHADDRGVFFRAGIGPAFAYGSISEVSESGTVYGGGFAFDIAVGGHVRPVMVVGGAILTTVLIAPTYDVSHPPPYMPSRQVGTVGSYYILALGPFFDWEPTQGGPFSVHGAPYVAGLVRFGDRHSEIQYGYLNAYDGSAGAGIGATVGAAYRISRGEAWDIGVVVEAQYLTAVTADKVANHLRLFMPAVLLSGTTR